MGTSTSGTVVERLRAALGADRVLTDDPSRALRRHDYWVLSQLADLQGPPVPLPLCVIRPSSLSDVVAAVNICRDTSAPLVPYGLGSGVCGGVLVSDDAAVLDIGALHRLRSIDETNLLATFDAGVRGSDAEDALVSRGLTLGHYPQSIGVSSVGGWVATRAAGQLSTGYGSIEDIVLSLEAVLPSGDVIDPRRTPRAAAGPDLRHLLMGSEGTLGVVTGVTLSVRRKPEKQAGSAFYVPGMEQGFELQRRILQRGLRPVAL